MLCIQFVDMEMLQLNNKILSLVPHVGMKVASIAGHINNHGVMLFISASIFLSFNQLSSV